MSLFEEEPLDQLRRHITELIDHCSTTEWVADTSRTHHVDSPGLLDQASDAGTATLTRGGSDGVRRAPGSRPPGRWDIMTLSDLIFSQAEKLRRKIRGRDCRPAGSVVTALQDLEALAQDGDQTKLICSRVASWVGTAKVSLGYAAPPAQTNLHCPEPECGTLLVAPQREDGSRYLLCPNQECVNEDGRRRSWNEYQVPDLKRRQKTA